MTTVETFRPSPGDLPTRDAIPVRYKWDLSSICRDWDEWTAAYRRLDEGIEAREVIAVVGFAHEHVAAESRGDPAEQRRAIAAPLDSDQPRA